MVRPAKSRSDVAFFCREIRFAYSPATGRAAKRVRKALLRKNSEPDVHAARFGIKTGGTQPSDTTRGFASLAAG